MATWSGTVLEHMCGQGVPYPDLVRCAGVSREWRDDLRKALTADPNMFARTVTMRLMTYALGRPVEASDMPEVRTLVREIADEDYRFSALIKGIANSQAFRYSVIPGHEAGEHLAANR